LASFQESQVDAEAFDPDQSGGVSTGKIAQGGPPQARALILFITRLVSCRADACRMSDRAFCDTAAQPFD
jgi:hypothetical protein